MEGIGALVTGGDFQGLGVIRSLGRQGIPVKTIDHELSIARFSRYSRAFNLAPHPAEEFQYVRFLEQYAQGLGREKWVIYANNDSVVRILAKHRDRLKNYYRVPTPDWEVIQNVYNKKNSYQLAESIGIPIPRTYYPKNMSEIEELILNYPVVIKPATRDFFFARFRKKAILVRNSDELRQNYRVISQVIPSSEIMIQEFIPAGPKNLYSFCPFFKDGKAVASIMARRARQHPMDFGQATTYAEVVIIPELEEYGTRFLSAINYYGLAEVEFMYDPRDSRYKFLEVNARVWGWHTLAIGAGLDLPYLLYKDMIGQAPVSSSSARSMKWIRSITDVPTSLLEILKGRMSINEYIGSLKGDMEFAVFAADDPLPFIAELLMIPYLWLKRGF
jgi:D-aspartate ligase